MRLETDRLILRQPEGRDADAMAAFYMTERSQYVGGYQGLRQAWMMTAAMLGHWTHREYGLFAVTLKEDDRIIGLVGPWYPVFWPETELGWLMFDGFEGKGFAHEAALAARDFCRQTLGWDEIVSYISPANDRSIRLAERLGARFDAHATQPNPDKYSLVYRHPKTEAAS